jgi:hypothetical protein
VKKENIFSAPVTIVSRRVIDDVKRFFLYVSFVFVFHKQHKTQEDILKQTEIEEEKRREEKKRKNSV